MRLRLVTFKFDVWRVYWITIDLSYLLSCQSEYGLPVGSWLKSTDSFPRPLQLSNRFSCIVTMCCQNNNCQPTMRVQYLETTLGVQHYGWYINIGCNSWKPKSCGPTITKEFQYSIKCQAITIKPKTNTKNKYSFWKFLSVVTKFYSKFVHKQQTSK